MPRRTVVESTRKETALEALHLALKRAGRRQRPRPGKPGFTAVEQTMKWWRADWDERTPEQRQTDLFSATSWAKVRQRREAHADVDADLLPLYVDQLAVLLEEATLLPVAAAESPAVKSKRAAPATKSGAERTRGVGPSTEPAGAEVGDEAGMAPRRDGAGGGAPPPPPAASRAPVLSFSGTAADLVVEQTGAAARCPPRVFTKNRMLRVRADSDDYDARAGKRAAIAWVEQAPPCCPPSSLCDDFPSCFSPPSAAPMPCCSQNWFSGGHPIVNHDGHHDILVGGRLYHLRAADPGAADAADADGKQMAMTCGLAHAGASAVGAMAMTPVGGGGGSGAFVWEDHGGVELLDEMLLDSLEAELAGELACDGPLRPPSPPPGVGAAAAALAGASLAPPPLASVSELPLCAKHEELLVDPAKLPARADAGEEKPCSSCACSKCGVAEPHTH